MRAPATERTFILGMWFDGDEACHVASRFAHEQISFASNAGAEDGRFFVVDEFRVMIQPVSRKAPGSRDLGPRRL